MAKKLVYLLCLSILPLWAQFDEELKEVPVKSELLINRQVVTAGGEFYLLLRMDIKDQWHVYWQNPGDSGLPVSISWEGSSSKLKFGELKFPTPQRLDDHGLVSFCHEGEVYFLTKVVVSEDVEEGQELLIKGTADWLMCKESCHAGAGTYSAKVKVGQTPYLGHLILERELNSQPRMLKKAVKSSSYKDSALAVDLAGISSEVLKGAKKVHFFPLDMDSVSIEKPVSYKISQESLKLLLVAEEKPKLLKGLVKIFTDIGVKAYLVDEKL